MDAKGCVRMLSPQSSANPGSCVRKNECALLSCGVRAWALRRSRTHDTSLAVPRVRGALPSRASRADLDDRCRVMRVKIAGVAQTRTTGEEIETSCSETNAVESR
jgi:hypothetical protein